MSKEVRFEVDGKEYVIKPLTPKQSTEAQRVYNKTFKTAVEDGAILKRSLDDHMRRQGLWDDEKQEEYETLIKKSADIEYKIKSKAYNKASELRAKALELKKLRAELSELLSVRNSMDSVTADGQADNQRFLYMVSACVYDFATQKPVYSSLEDYLENGETELAMRLAAKYADHIYGLEENYQDNLIENKLLKKLNLLNDKGELVNREGKRVDVDGNLLDDDGARVDADGNRIDINNNPVIDDSVIDELEFEDDLAEEKAKEKTPKRKPRSRTKKSETT